MAEIGLDQVSKRFSNGLTVLSEITLTVKEGEMVVFLGPTGCGKTTLLRVIAGLENPSSGVITIAGKPVNRVTPANRNLGFVFQRPALYPHLNVERNLLFGLTLQRNLSSRVWQRLWPGAPRFGIENQAKLKRTAKLLNLGDLLSRWPRELSGGQQQLVALGRAIMRDPVAFLLDEPLSGVDLPQRGELRRQLHLLQRHLPATMLYVTHDQTEAMALADRVVVINRGAVLQTGPPSEVFGKPVNRFVASFIGTPPMKFLAGQVGVEERELKLTNGEGEIHLPDWIGRQLKHYSFNRIVVGVRPEHVKLGEIGSDGKSGNDPSLMMEIATVEFQGHGCLVTLRRGSWELTSQQYGSAPWIPGDIVEVFLDGNHLHWFDSDSGRRLNLAAAL